MTIQTDERTQKPSLWSQAMKVVKGDTTTELVEQFTQEMTLVAEGLFEDQARLRGAVDGLIRETEAQRQKADQDYQELLRQLDEAERKTTANIKELSHRIAALEKPAKTRKGGSLAGDLISKVTLLAGIICGSWIIVTILKLFM